MCASAVPRSLARSCAAPLGCPPVRARLFRQDLEVEPSFNLAGVEYSRPSLTITRKPRGSGPGSSPGRVVGHSYKAQIDPAAPSDLTIGRIRGCGKRPKSDRPESVNVVASPHHSRKLPPQEFHLVSTPRDSTIEPNCACASPREPRRGKIVSHGSTRLGPGHGASRFERACSIRASAGRGDSRKALRAMSWRKDGHVRTAALEP